MKYIQLLILVVVVYLCLPLNPLDAQLTVTGKVVTTNDIGVQGASIVVTNKSTGKILSYDITDIAGHYKVIFNVEQDSLLLTLSHLSYNAGPKIIHKNERVVNWIVEEASFTLPALEVKPKSVVRRGDTLIFNASDLEAINDQNLEDILSRIPGIKIENSGQIKYKGLPISRFYIEGLDLLEGKYALATRSLRPNVVQDIEILENHQHIRALDGIVDPPNAAINVKLKSSITLTGHVEGGLGFSPVLYKLKGVLFGFGKNQQVNLTSGANNAGYDQKRDFTDFYHEKVRKHLVRVQAVKQPHRVKAQNIQDNREIISGISILRKINEKNQLKIQLLAGNDLLRRIGNRTTTITNGNLSVNFAEELSATQKASYYQGRMIWESNLSSTYLKGRFSVDVDREKISTDNLINNTSTGEKLQQPSLSIEGETSMLLKRKERVFQVKASHNYKKYDYYFSVQPVPVILSSLSDVDSIEDVSQTSQLRESLSELRTGFYYKLGRFKANAEAGAAYETKNFSNDLKSDNDEMNITDPAYDQFNGLTSRAVASLYFNNSYRAKFGKVDAELKIPLAWHTLRTKNKTEPLTIKNNLLVTNTRLSLSRKFPKGALLTLGADYILDYYQDQVFFQVSVLTDNRNVSRSILEPLQYRQYGVNVTYQKENLFKNVAYYGYFGLAFNRREQLYSNVFDDLGTITNVLSAGNNQKFFQSRHDLSTNLWSWGLVSVGIIHALSSAPSIINNEFLRIRQHELKVIPKISWTFGNNVLGFKPYLRVVANSVSESNIWESNLALTYFRDLPGQFGKFNVSWEAYRTVINGREINNHLLSAWYKIDLPKSKMDVSIHVNNLLNTASYVSFQQFGFTENLTLFRLRERQLLLVLKRDL